MAKVISNKMKKQKTDWGKILTTCVPDKGLISKIIKSIRNAIILMLASMLFI